MGIQNASSQVRLREGSDIAQGHTAQAGTHAEGFLDTDSLRPPGQATPISERRSLLRKGRVRAALRPEPASLRSASPSPGCPPLRPGPGGGGRGPAAAGCSQRGPWGRGRPQRGRRLEGPRPFLSVPPTAQQLYLRQGKAATLENKNPKGGTSLAALEDCWAPTPLQGPPGATGGGWETLGPGPAASSGAHLLPCASPTVDVRSLGREGGT